MRIFANVVKFEREKPIPIGREETKAGGSINKVNNGSSGAILHGKSFVDAVKGSNPISMQEGPIVRLRSSEVSRKWLQFALAGKVKSLNNLWSIASLMKDEGCDGIQLRYLGGLFILLDFDSPELASMFLENARDKWTSWFDNLHSWSSEFKVLERLASLVISGIPPHAWSSDAYTEVAKVWGDVVEPEECNENNFNMMIGRVGIITKHMELINYSGIIEVDSKLYVMRILEDPNESYKMCPHFCSSFKMFGNSELDCCFSRSDESVDDSNEDDDNDLPDDDLQSPEFVLSLDKKFEKRDMKSQEEVEETQAVGSDVDKDLDASCPHPMKNDESNFNLGVGSSVDPRDDVDPTFNMEPQLNRVESIMNKGQGIREAHESDVGPDINGALHGPCLNETQDKENKAPLMNRKSCARNKPPLTVKPLSVLGQSLKRMTKGKSVQSHSHECSKVRVDDEGNRKTNSLSSGYQVPSDSHGLSSEVKDTLEIGKLVGFQLEGCNKEIQKVIDGAGDVNVFQ